MRLSAAFTRQQLCLEFAALKHACPKGVYVAPLPDEPLRWAGVLFVRKGPYAGATLRFQIDFPPDYPTRPPTLTILSDVFHPLVSPLTTYTHSVRDSGSDTVSSGDRDRLPPGGLSLRSGFPEWHDSGSIREPSVSTSTSDATHTAQHPRPRTAYAADVTGDVEPVAHPPEVIEVLQYLRVVFDTEAVLDSLPLDDAANANAWHAWKSFRSKSTSTSTRSSVTAAARAPSPVVRAPSVTSDSGDTSSTPADRASSPRQQPGGARRPGEWNWQGVWEDRVRKAVQASNSEHMLFGAGAVAAAGDGCDVLSFTKMQPDVVAQVLRTETGGVHKPALGRQRDHSTCRHPQTPLKVRKTRENLKQSSIYADIPPPCVHPLAHQYEELASDAESQRYSLDDDGASGPSREEGNLPESATSKKSPYTVMVAQPLPSSASHLERQKSVSRRMLSMVKQGIRNRSKSSRQFPPTDSEATLVRRFSDRRKLSSDRDRRAQSFDLSRENHDLGPRFSVELARPVDLQSGWNAVVSTTGLSNASTGGGSAGLRAESAFSVDISPTASSSSDTSPLISQPATLNPNNRIQSRVDKSAGPAATLAVPCVELDVTAECAVLDVNTTRDLWVAIHAKIGSQTTIIRPEVHREEAKSRAHSSSTLPNDNSALSRDPTPQITYGLITSLRLCFKPVENCRVLATIGQKSAKNLAVGQQCELFVRLHVPAMNVKADRLDDDDDQQSLFAELESLVGTLETEILHVEARYRHFLLPSDNIVTVRRSCKINRPDSDSRWSLVGLSDDEDVASPSEPLALRLARCIVSRYPPDRAMQMLQLYIDSETSNIPALRDFYDDLNRRQQSEQVVADIGPCVVITDSDTISHSEQRNTCKGPNLPTHPLSETRQSQPRSPADSALQPSNPPTLPSPVSLPLISAPKTTTALTIQQSDTISRPSSANSQRSSQQESQDSARQLWRHIRRTSLSTNQLEEITLENLQQLEAGDEQIRDLRRKALANKRSVGAETLKGWKWEGSASALSRIGEAPWM